MPCKLCYRDEPRCDPERLILCGLCVQVLLHSTQEQIRADHKLAIEEGYLEKAEALSRFIKVGDYSGKQINTRREPRHIAKHLDRGRGSKINRPQKRTVGRLPEQEADAVSQNQSELQAVFGE